MMRILGVVLAILLLPYLGAWYLRPDVSELGPLTLDTLTEPPMPGVTARGFLSNEGAGGVPDGFYGSTFIRIADPKGRAFNDIWAQGPGDVAGVIVLVHGFSNPSYVFRDYYKPLSDAGYLVVAFDIYGRGYSSRPWIPHGEWLFLKQLDGVVSTLARDRPVHLIGYSMGGAIAARYAAKYPDKVETVGLIAPASLACGAAVASPMTWPVVGDWVFRVLGPWFLESYSGADWAEAKDPDYWRARYREMAKYRGYEDALLSTLRNFNFLDSCDDMKTLTASGKRVLAIFAEKDKTIPIAHADVLAAFPGNARIVRVPSRGHAITYAAPDAVIPEILKLVSLEP
jgi:pimeloyl-ACP methyl ester carboxylesterase